MYYDVTEGKNLSQFEVFLAARNTCRCGAPKQNYRRFSSMDGARNGGQLAKFVMGWQEMFFRRLSVVLIPVKL